MESRHNCREFFVHNNLTGQTIIILGPAGIFVIRQDMFTGVLGFFKFYVHMDNIAEEVIPIIQTYLCQYLKGMTQPRIKIRYQNLVVYRMIQPVLDQVYDADQLRQALKGKPACLNRYDYVRRSADGVNRQNTKVRGAIDKAIEVSDNPQGLAKIKKEILKLTRRFPLYPELREK